MRPAPEISVITTTYNDVPYLSQAIESILSQTFTNFEYVIIDNGSTDETPQMLAEYAAKDIRIVVRRNEKNMGRSLARNWALELTRGKWVAVFDGDDISHPERLEKQIGYLSAHPEVDYMGTGCRPINKQTGESMPDRVIDQPLSHGQIYWKLCFDFPFHHSSTIGRRGLFIEAGGYPPAYPVCEDIFLWMAMAKRGARFGNIDEELLTYRVNTKPDHYALNQAVAQQLHRNHVASILKTNVSEAAFSIVWLTNAEEIYGPAPEADSIHSAEAIGILITLYRTLKAQNIFADEGKLLIQADLLGRIRKAMMLTDSVDGRYRPYEYQYAYQYTHQYTYQLPVISTVEGHTG